MRIIADSAALITPEEGRKMGVTIIPVGVIINGESYRDYEEMDTASFLKLVQAGGVPTSSQPSIGDVQEVLEEGDEEMIFLTVGDGLSGAYQTAMAARSCIEKNDHIHILNTKTLAGPMRHLVRKAAELKAQGMDIEKIMEELQRRIESSMSFVVPEDFDFLKRSGRLTPIAAKIGGALRLLPVLTQTKDKTRIMPVTIKRTWKSAIEAIMQRMQSDGVDENYLISICHAGTPDKAAAILEKFRERFSNVEAELLELSPALTTHGGPGCIVVQAILK